MQGRDEGRGTGSVHPQQATVAAGDDGVSGQDFTTVGHAVSLVMHNGLRGPAAPETP